MTGGEFSIDSGLKLFLSMVVLFADAVGECAVLLRTLFLPLFNNNLGKSDLAQNQNRPSRGLKLGKITSTIHRAPK